MHRTTRGICCHPANKKRQWNDKYIIPKLIIRNDRLFFQITGNAAAINKTNAVPSIRNSAPNKNTKYKIALIKGSTIALLRIHSIETLMLFRKSGCYTS